MENRRSYLANVQDEPRLWVARLLRSRRRDSHGRWLWRLVRPFVSQTLSKVVVKPAIKQKQGMDESWNLDALATRQCDCRARRSRKIERTPIAYRRNVTDKMMAL